MAFTVEDFQDLLRLLEQRPEWRAELRRYVLTDDLVELPSLVRALTEAQARTEQVVVELVRAQARTEQRVEELVQTQPSTDSAWASWPRPSSHWWAGLAGWIAKRSN